VLHAVAQTNRADAGHTQKTRIMIDWTFALLFTPDIVKISLDSENVELDRKADNVDATGQLRDEEAPVMANRQHL
jgi:hypothetical protein